MQPVSAVKGSMRVPAMHYLPCINYDKTVFAGCHSRFAGANAFLASFCHWQQLCWLYHSGTFSHDSAILSIRRGAAPIRLFPRSCLAAAGLSAITASRGISSLQHHQHQIRGAGPGFGWCFLFFSFPSLSFQVLPRMSETKSRKKKNVEKRDQQSKCTRKEQKRKKTEEDVP